MFMAEIWVYPPSQHEWSHWKCVMCCCSNFPYVYFPGKKLDRHHSNISPSVLFMFITFFHGVQCIEGAQLFYMCLLKRLEYNTAVNQNIPNQKQQHNHPHSMLCFNPIFLMKANKMLPQLIHTENA